MPRPSPLVVTQSPARAAEYGEVFTRTWVVEMILDLSGYTVDRDLSGLTVVEPACGTGAFLGPIAQRLSASCRRFGRTLHDAENAIRAFDLLPQNVETSRRVVEKILLDDGWPANDVYWVTERWVRQGDYLLIGHEPNSADFVLGNPPYIRLEDVPTDRMAAYRAACSTMTGRADVYVGFFEKSLLSLRPGGVLGFICADRWMRNQYGRRLRQLISSRFSMVATIAMHDVDAFEEQVSAYPAITVIRRARQGSVVVANTTRAFGPEDAAAIVTWTRSNDAAPINNSRYEIARLPHWFAGSDPWPSAPPKRLALIEYLNDQYPPLEDPSTGTRVGIGVATGADRVFVTTNADVESDRMLPLSMVRDTVSGNLSWSGNYLINPWDSDGNLVDLDDFPKLKSYFRRHAATLRGRHVAVRRPDQWYRTIDKVDHSLVNRPKLLFPDLKQTIHPVLDDIGLYPHHNLYYIVSDAWDLRVLGGLLLSKVAETFVDAYAVKMRGGTLRFQAQYLRRIRVPRPDQLSERDCEALVEAFESRDGIRATEVALRVYDIEDMAGEFANES